ncbi:unnamed protein product [Mycena citricolor]|uniref:Gag protein n=1 Tax=Mycena citricolor TaxID=2018698 RepID=A0AAD2K7E2_9AGAR|nr:unnamed protein product [Mycena citricolor]
MAYIQACTMAVDAWTRLQPVYQPKGAISIICLRRHLFRTLCEERENIEEHIRKLTQMRTALQNFGQTIDEAKFATIILTSLPESCDNWVNGIDLTTIKESKEIVAWIIQQAGRPQAKPNLLEETALPAFGISRPSTGTGEGCFHFGRPGHWIAECRDQQNGRIYTDQQRRANAQ